MKRIWAFLPVPILAIQLAAPAPAGAACHFLALCACTATASGVNFGNYNPVDSGHLNSTGTVSVRCTQLLPLPGSFTVDLSTGGSGSYATRRMTNGGSQLQYNLYRDVARSQIWGNGTGVSTDVTESFNGTRIVDRTINVYGRVFAGQDVSGGVYADTIVVTVVY